MINEQLESVGRKLKEESYGEVNKLMTALRMEMEHQVEIGLKAYRELEKALEEADGPEVWYSAHSFLNSIAKISDILRWCEKKRDNGLQDDMISALTSENWSLLDKTRNYIVTEYVNQSDFLNNIYPHSANTMRILVMNPEDSDPFIARSVLRIGTDRSGVFDNFSQGGLSVEINLKNGELSPAASRISPGNLKWYKKHPDTNTIIKGSTIPQWKILKIIS